MSQFHDHPDRLDDGSLDEATAVVDAHGAIVAWSPGAARLLGYPALAVLHQPVYGLLLNAETELRRCAAFGKRRSFTASVRRSDGSDVLLRLSVTELETGDDPLWLVRVESEVSADQSRYERALMEALADEAPIAVGVYGADLRSVMRNAELRRISGLRKGERIGYTITESLPGLDGAVIEERQREVLRTGRGRTDEVRGTTPADPAVEHIWMESMFPLRETSGEVFALGHVIMDVTEHVRTRERLSLAYALGSRIGSNLDVTQTADELADAVVPELADEIIVELWPEVPWGQQLPSAERLDRFLLQRISWRPAGGDTSAGWGSSPLVDRLVEQALREGGDRFEGVVFEDSTPATGVISRCSRVILPLAAGGALLGFAVLTRHGTRAPFNKADLMLLRHVTEHASASIDNARRYTAERTIALTLRESLVSSSSASQSAVEVATRYLPVARETGLGGDWFDVIPLPGARVGLVIGDAVGHGLEAAVTMGWLRGAVRTLADLDLPPDELLTHLCDQVHRTFGGTALSNDPDALPEALGSTCLYAVYDPVSARCAMASSGHLPPVIVPPNGSATLLDMPVAPPLGVGGLPVELTEIDVAEGSTLAFFTDGLIDLRQYPDIDDRLEELRHALESAGASPQALCESVLTTMTKQASSDDTTLLVTRTHRLDAGCCVSWDVNMDDAEVPRVRALAVEQLLAWGLSDLEFTTALVVSELVTNAIRYGVGPVRLRLIKDRNLICEVSDGSSTSPHMRRAHMSDEGGRGLFLVAQLAAAWGTRYGPRGKTIWAEQALG